MKHLVVLSGAGISAESGIKTFRDANGLWEGHDVMEVATPQGFENNPNLVLEFYNQRRRQLAEVKPNLAHHILATLEQHYEVSIITQNVDDLHERAGSKNVFHLHGELLKSRSANGLYHIQPCLSDIKLGEKTPDGFQKRPHIVWFGEDVPMMQQAIKLCETADILLIIGTSLQVYPAAGLMHYTPENIPSFYIDPKPNIKSNSNLKVIPQNATEGMETLKQYLLGI